MSGEANKEVILHLQPLREDLPSIIDTGTSPPMAKRSPDQIRQTLLEWFGRRLTTIMNDGALIERESPRNLVLELSLKKRDMGVVDASVQQNLLTEERSLIRIVGIDGIFQKQL